MHRDGVFVYYISEITEDGRHARTHALLGFLSARVRMHGIGVHSASKMRPIPFLFFARVNQRSTFVVRWSLVSCIGFGKAVLEMRPVIFNSLVFHQSIATVGLRAKAVGAKRSDG